MAEEIGALSKGVGRLARRDEGETGLARQKCADLIAILRVQHRASDVHDATAWLDQRGGAVEHGRLLLEPHRERAGTHAPLGIGIAPPCSDAGAGRVDEHEVSAAGEIGELSTYGFRRADLHVAHARTREALMDRREPTLVGVGGIKLSLIMHRCRERERLAAGTGAWRRNPDAKWRVRPGALAERLKDQAETLDRAVPLVKPGGRIAYVTCSVLDDENGAQVKAFVARHPQFSVVPPAEVMTQALGERAFLFRRAVLLSDNGLLMTPRRTDTDGFFVSLLRKVG